MKGNEDVIKVLNEVLSAELTAMTAGSGVSLFRPFLSIGDRSPASAAGGRSITHTPGIVDDRSST